MVKDTYLYRNRTKLPIITKSVKRNSIWVIISLMVVFLIFNFFIMLQLNSYFNDAIDTRLEHELEHIELSVIYEADSLKIVSPTEFEESDLTEVSESSFFLQIYNNTGDTLFISRNVNEYESIPIEFPSFSNKYYFQDLHVKYAGLRTVYAKFLSQNGNQIGLIQLSTPKAAINEVVENLVLFNLYSLPFIIILFTLISFFFIKRTLNPINKIIDLADEVTASNISKRIYYLADSNDEFGRLRDTLNDLFERLEFQIGQIAQFSDNASHQLMTPLTAINTELEYVLKREHSSEDYKESLKLVQHQTKQMIQIVKTLLILARDCEACAPGNKVFNFTSLIENEISRNYKNVQVSYNIEDNIYLLGEVDYFKMVIENIINNALKYSSNQQVIVDALIVDDRAKIRIKDQGIGIPDDEKKKIFDRFFRGKDVEAEGIKGYGLGLSLCDLVVSKMNGKIIIEDNVPQGSIFTIEIPAVIMD